MRTLVGILAAPLPCGHVGGFAGVEYIRCEPIRYEFAYCGFVEIERPAMSAHLCQQILPHAYPQVPRFHIAPIRWRIIRAGHKTGMQTNDSLRRDEPLFTSHKKHGTYRRTIVRHDDRQFFVLDHLDDPKRWKNEAADALPDHEAIDLSLAQEGFETVGALGRDLAREIHAIADPGHFVVRGLLIDIRTPQHPNEAPVNDGGIEQRQDVENHDE